MWCKLGKASVFTETYYYVSCQTLLHIIDDHLICIFLVLLPIPRSKNIRSELL